MSAALRRRRDGAVAGDSTGLSSVTFATLADNGEQAER